MAVAWHGHFTRRAVGGVRIRFHRDQVQEYAAAGLVDGNDDRAHRRTERGFQVLEDLVEIGVLRVYQS